MVIQHNMAAMFGHRRLGITSNTKAKSSEKLSSGYKINRAADDAAGLAISEKMRKQIRGLGQNMANIQDGISFIQVADGYLNEVHNMLQRINELSVKGANDTLTSNDRIYINEEIQGTKKEIDRIFDSASFNNMKIFKVPYTPSIEPNSEPYDIQIFYSSSDQIGGLEFNNVRYNLDELTEKGLKLDSNGLSTEDQTVDFELWDGEKVTLTLNEGDPLSAVTRKYEWKADDTGIKVNNVLAATWSELGISGDGEDEGSYSFDYHGTTISFDVEDGDSLTAIIEGINGNSITSPSYWNISPSSITNRTIATLSTPSTVTVTQSNKVFADDQYEIIASSEGLSIKRTGLVDNDTSSTSSVSNWSSFSNVGNTITRIPSEGHDGSYPIVDWGLDNDSNDSSQVTFDTEALYQYSTTIDNVPISYTFSLADVSSQEEVIEAMNNTDLAGNVYTGKTVLSTTSNALSISTNANITSGGQTAFNLQRSYGRNFDTNDTLTGKISWESTAGTETEHTLTYQNTHKTDPESTNTTEATSTYYFKDGDKYYIETEKITTTTTAMETDEQYTWSQNYSVDINGNLNTANMDTITKDITAYFTQDITYSYTRTTTTKEYSDRIELTSEEVENITQTIEDSSRTSSSNTEDSTKNKSSDNTSFSSGNLSVNSDFAANSDVTTSAFNFTYAITYDEIVNSGNGEADLTLEFKANATRTFSNPTKSNSVDEYDFMNIVLVPPRKELLIQSTPDSILDDQIPINWSALSLSIIGMTGTNTLTQSSSLGSIDLTKNAINKISLERAGLGATQNRLEHAYNYTANAQENTQHSESMIRDTDMNSEITKLRNHEVLEQAGQAMLAQANQSKQGVLNLLV